jgi:hypothetical protein
MRGTTSWNASCAILSGHNVQDHGLWRAQRPHAAREGVLALLLAGAEHTGQDLLRVRALPSAVPAPHLARDHHTAKSRAPPR